MQPTQPSSASTRNTGALLNRTPVWLCSLNRTPALEAVYACSTNPLETSIALAILVSGGTLHIFHQLSWQASPPTLICGPPVFSPFRRWSFPWCALLPSVRCRVWEQPVWRTWSCLQVPCTGNGPLEKQRRPPCHLLHVSTMTR